MSQICIVGTGYVGLVTAACFAKLGHVATCVDIDHKKIDQLRRGQAPIYEPGLDELVASEVQAKRLRATTSLREGLLRADFVFVCVGTPRDEDGRVNLGALNDVYIGLKSLMNGKRAPIIVNKSTVPPGTSDMMQFLMNRERESDVPVTVASNPEFLREGRAIHDFLHPSRIIVGAHDRAVAEQIVALYSPSDCPVRITSPREAETIKYASNAFLATKISFINEFAGLCEKLDIDIDTVAEGMGLDPRIGPDFLRAGVGYGGSCLPKDIAVLLGLGHSAGLDMDLLSATVRVNDGLPERFADRIRETCGGRLDGVRITVLGCTFKPDTDDMRESPAIALSNALAAHGAQVHVCDPIFEGDAPSVFPPNVCLFSDPYEASEGSEAVVLATEWSAFKEIDLPRLRSLMHGNVLADGRNVFDPAAAKAAGFTYLGVGRSCAQPEQEGVAVKEGAALRVGYPD